MREYLAISCRATRPRSPFFHEWLRECAAAGIRSELEFGAGAQYRLLVPLGNRTWKRRLREAADSGLISKDWERDVCIQYFVQEYSEEDVGNAPLFSLVHVGHDIRIPTPRGEDIIGLCHFTQVDRSGMCTLCHSGARQVGLLRIRGGELNTCGRFGDIMIGANEFYLLAESLVDEIEQECSCDLPRREVEAMGSRPRERWFQLAPEFMLPAAAVLPVHSGKKRVCRACGSVQFDSPPDVFGSYDTLSKAGLAKAKLPPVVLCPILQGELKQCPDGA
jgi:hypothetical protein